MHVHVCWWTDQAFFCLNIYICVCVCVLHCPRLLAQGLVLNADTSRGPSRSGAIAELREDEDEAYFSSYGHYSIHEEMLKVGLSHLTYICGLICFGRRSQATHTLCILLKKDAMVRSMRYIFIIRHYLFSHFAIFQIY